MVKGDEKRFLVSLYRSTETPRKLINAPGFTMHHKRAWYLLEKWCIKDWYEYGVTLDLGWLACEGKQKAREWEGNDG